MVILKSGLLSTSEKGKITQDGIALNPDVSTIKPKAPEYSFPKEDRGGESSGSTKSSHDNAHPGAIYDLPGSIGDFDPRKGKTFPKSSNNF